MNKLDLARRIARHSHRSPSQAADAVDSLVYSMLKEIKRDAARLLKKTPRDHTASPSPRPNHAS